MVEVARLESVYRFIAYPGFESPSLRQKTNESHPRVAFLFSGGEKKSPFGLFGGDSKGWAYSPSPLRIAHLPPLRGGAPEAPRAAHAKFPQALFYPINCSTRR